MKKGKKTKFLRVDERLYHIFKTISETEGKNRKWSKTADKYMWMVCNNLFPEQTKAILKSYETAENILENPLVKEIIKNESSNL